MSTNAAALARVELGLNVALAFARVNVFAVETINVPSTPYK